MFYFALVDSKLLYGISTWGGVYYNSIYPLVISQKRSVRTMSFKNRIYPSAILFSNLQILPLRYIYVFKVLKVFYCKSGNKTTKIKKICNTRQSFCYTPLPQREHFKHCALYTAPYLYNKLPSHLKCKENRKDFLNELKLWLLSLSTENFKKICLPFN